MQFPVQLRETGDASLYEEVLNNVGTVVTGRVPAEQRLAERLATEDAPAEQVGNRLRALARGEWLVSLPARFDRKPPQPFLLSSLAAPTDEVACDAFESERTSLTDQTVGDTGGEEQ